MNEEEARGESRKGRRMDLDEIRGILDMMKENDLSEFEIEDEGFRLSAKRGAGDRPPPPPPLPAAPNPAQGAAPDGETAGEETGWVDIVSPMVGTIYRAASPEAQDFVSVGQEVDADTVVCIVEAMKVMNEIKAETRGIVRKICVENAAPVQFGQILFQVEPVD